MTQSEYDKKMHDLRVEQHQQHINFDRQQQDLNDQVAYLEKQIFDIRKQIIDLNNLKHRVAQDRFRMDADFRARKAELAYLNPKSSMEPEHDLGHTIQDDGE